MKKFTKKTLVAIGVIGILSGGASVASADSFLDMGEDRRVWLEQGVSHTWNFDLLNDDLVAGRGDSTPVTIDPFDILTNATVAVGFFDRVDPFREAASAVPSGFSAATRVERDLEREFRFDLGTVTDLTGGTTIYNGTIHDGQKVFGNVLGTLVNNTLTIDIEVASQRGAFGVSRVALFGNFEQGDRGADAPVPEPATMLLFGTGLAGLAGFGRKKIKK